MKYYIDCSGCIGGNGSKEKPFVRIQEAADVAMPGDEVLVFPGIYRENVDPKQGGTMAAPIVYRSVEPLKAVITGAEIITGWKSVEAAAGVWTASVDNTLFENHNPYDTLISGDWFVAYNIAHTGDVYLNGKSMYEVTSLDAVIAHEVYKPSWDQAFSVYKWYAEVDEAKTTFYCYFGELDPNQQLTEISVRPNCFYPQAEGMNYITLSGFTVCQAATQWAPPTAYQEGMIGPHWSKGWIIEDCHVFESKCSGISLGKYLQPDNDNKWLKTKYKDGTQTERECICQAQREGWTKERIGHHIIRRCTIHDCGQTGIVGHLGGVFSVIEDNHIYNINNKQNITGAETGGIKMHAAIDVIYRRNVIHHCTRGIWLDWQAQGTRVTQNLLFDNTLPEMQEDYELDGSIFQAIGEDIFIEVSHGPTLVDHNICLSERALKIPCQGVAAVHNILAGSLAAVGIGTDNGTIGIPSPRYTPYHVPHQTEVAGFMTFLHGDMRFYNNIFVQTKVRPALLAVEKMMSSDGNLWDDGCMSVGTYGFDAYPTFEIWNQQFEGYCGMGSPASNRYYTHLPVWSEGNLYLGGAKPWKHEKDALMDDQHEVFLTVKRTESGFVFESNLDEIISDLVPDDYCKCITTEDLGMAFEPEQRFENPDGSDIIFDEDYYGQKRSGQVRPGAVR